jgi:copper chaperone CopZ
MVCLVSANLAGWVCGCGKSETAPSAEPAKSNKLAAPVSAPAEPAKSNEMMAPVIPPSTKPAEAGTNTPLEPEPGTQVVTLAITGMHCDACAQTISQELGKVKGVRKAHASFPAKTAWVMVDRRGGPDINELIKTVEAAGYKVAPAVTVKATGYKAAPAVSAGPASAPH